VIRIGPCEQLVPLGPGNPGAMFVSAGDVSVTGGTKPVTLMPQPDNTYPPFMEMGIWFDAGQTLMVSGTGATVPAFSKSVVVPSQVNVIAPARPANFMLPLALDRSQDLTVRWTGGNHGTVQVTLGDEGADMMPFTCHFASAAGKGVIPKEVLQRLKANGRGI